MLSVVKEARRIWRYAVQIQAGKLENTRKNKNTKHTRKDVRVRGKRKDQTKQNKTTIGILDLSEFLFFYFIAYRCEKRHNLQIYNVQFSW